jgi:hypothetical protein
MGVKLFCVNPHHFYHRKSSILKLVLSPQIEQNVFFTFSNFYILIF